MGHIRGEGEKHRAFKSKTDYKEEPNMVYLETIWQLSPNSTNIMLNRGTLKPLRSSYTTLKWCPVEFSYTTCMLLLKVKSTCVGHSDKGIWMCLPYLVGHSPRKRIQ